MVVEEQPLFVLHSRKYTDSKIIVDFVSLDFGRVSAVYRQSSTSKKTTKAQQFLPLVGGWRGKSSLKTLIQLEPIGSAIQLDAQKLFCGFYLNEVLLKALPNEDACPEIFRAYREVLPALVVCNSKKQIEITLRKFELLLLDQLGFGIDFAGDLNHSPIDPNCTYNYLVGQGFEPCHKGRGSFNGQVINALFEQNYDSDTTLKMAKRLCRAALPQIVGDKPIRARELFR